MDNIKIIARRTKRNRFNLKKDNKGVRPRLSVHRTARHIYAQVIDDAKGVTLASFSTMSKDFKGKKTWDIAAATAVGEGVAKLAKAAKVSKVVFDRGGYYYHGRVKALAEGARKGGLEF
jgi:large subunit ribosomal protein L18